MLHFKRVLKIFQVLHILDLMHYPNDDFLCRLKFLKTCLVRFNNICVVCESDNIKNTSQKLNSSFK